MNKPDSSQQRHLDGALPAEQIGDQTTPATAASTKDEVNKVLQATPDTLQPAIDLAVVVNAAESLPQAPWGTLLNQIKQPVMSLKELLGVNDLNPRRAYRDDINELKKPTWGNGLFLIGNNQ